MTKIEQTYISNIAIVGQAKSLFLETIDYAEQYDFDQALKLYDKAKDLLKKVSLQKNNEIKSLDELSLYLHLQNHFSSAETVELLATKFIQIYREMESTKV